MAYFGKERQELLVSPTYHSARLLLVEKGLNRIQQCYIIVKLEIDEEVFDGQAMIMLRLGDEVIEL